MDHEKRIHRLEKEMIELKELIKELTPKDKWLTLTEIHQQFGLGKKVLLKSIHGGQLSHLKDWRKNGNRFLVNVNSLKKIM